MENHCSINFKTYIYRERERDLHQKDGGNQILTGKQSTGTRQGNPLLLGHYLLQFAEDVSVMGFSCYCRIGIAFSILLLMGFCCYLCFPFFSI
jgi:hypothetical protein